MFPQVEINLTKIQGNARRLAEMCEVNGIKTRFLVTKVIAGDKRIVKSLINQGFSHLADSRIENLIKYQDLPLPKVLLRLPMKSEAKKVVKNTDISLNSEIETILALNHQASLQNRIHQIILMFDLGDLREGIFFQDNFLPQIEAILKLSNIKLIGIGTNLTCYGGVIPTKEILQKLVEIKERIEGNFNIQLSIISGGNSSSLYLLEKEEIPKEINNLRIGEALFLGRETAYGKLLNGLATDAFILKAEIIELKTKPSYPMGEIGMNSFGETPTIIDKGIMRRGILALGKQDVQFSNIFPLDDKVEIIGGSSDHLIIDLTRTNYQLGDIISFQLNYPGLLQVMTSSYVKKRYL